MAASLRSSVLRRSLTAAFSLRHRTPGAPAASTGLRFVRSAAPEGPKAAVVESTEEYRFVERLIPPSRIPAPPPHPGVSPSGWSPPAASPPALPYMVRRSRMHNVPVYSDVTHGNRRMTLIRRVEGDMWALDQDVRTHLKHVTGKEPPTQVNEVTGTLKVKGDYETELKDFLVRRGF